MEDKGRRSTPRVDVVLQLQYRSAGHLLVNYCTNLSRGGLFVPSTEPLPVGTQLQLELTVPGDATTTVLEGEVRWVRQFDADIPVAQLCDAVDERAAACLADPAGAVSL